MSKEQVDEILDRLRRHGGRVTTPRRVVIDAMLGADDHHLVAADIVATVRRQHPDFYESTVYRTLDRLVELQIVDRIQIGQGPAVFHLSHRAHQHLVCDECGAVVGGRPRPARRRRRGARGRPGLPRQPDDHHPARALRRLPRLTWRLRAPSPSPWRAPTGSAAPAASPSRRSGTTLPDGWVGLAAAADDPAVVSGWVGDARRGFAGGLADVAGAAVAAQVAGALVGVTVPPLLVARRGVPITPTGSAVHRHPGGWIDRVAVIADDVRVLADDPDARRVDTTVVDGTTALVTGVADDLVATLGPIFDRVRAVAPFGRSGMWGSTVDEVGVVATRLARDGAVDREDAWALADHLIDAIAARVPRLRSRPRRVDVTTAVGVVPFSRRGTCCLFYKLAAPGPARRAAYCATCPLLSDDEQHARLVASASAPPDS